jgi:arylsulfatase A-like enzyme
MWSASPELLPAHAALLTGCDPRLAQRPNVKVVGRESELASWYVPDGLPRLSQQFLANGFETAAFVDDAAISPVHGFAKGFQHLVGSREREADPSTLAGFDGVSTRFLNWLNVQPTARSWFAYMQVGDLDRVWQRTDVDPRWDTFFEPRPELARVPAVADGEHVFFAVPRGRWSGGTLSLGEYEARYDGALCQLDGKLRRLFADMRRRGWLENTTIVVVGSYGLSLGESGLFVDSGTLSDCDLHVPLIIRPALRFEVPRGATSDVLASTLDLAPTLLALHDLPIPKTMQGVSLVPALRGETTALREYAFASGGLQHGTVAIDARYCNEVSFPGAGFDPRLVQSWYGDTLDHRAEPRYFLHDRDTSTSPGHLEGSAECEAAAARLSAAATKWFAAVDQARAILHRPALTRSDDSAAVIEDLLKRGLLGRGAE